MDSPPPPEAPLGVVIADDDERVRISLSELIDDHPRLATIGTGGSGDAAAALCALHHPPLAVIDVIMPSGGTSAVRAILAVSPTTRIVAFTARSDRRMRDRLLESGASAVVTKGSDTDIAATLFQLATARATGDETFLPGPA